MRFKHNLATEHHIRREQMPPVVPERGLAMYASPRTLLEKLLAVNRWMRQLSGNSWLSASACNTWVHI